MDNDLLNLAREHREERTYHLADAISSAIVAALHGFRSLTSRMGGRVAHGAVSTPIGKTLEST